MHQSINASDQPNTRQQKLARALSEGTEISEALTACGISHKTFRAWMDSPAFVSAMKFQQTLQIQQGRLLIGRNVPRAASRLIELLNSDKEETVRKTCLDILELAQQYTRDIETTHRQQKASHLTPEIAEKVLEALAESDVG